MKRFGRWLFNGLALLLCVVTIGLWMRSYWRQDAMPFLVTSSSTCFLADWRGHVELTRQYVVPAMPSGWGADTSTYGNVGIFRQGGGLRGGGSCDPHLIAPDEFYFGHTVELGYSIISTTQIIERFQIWAAPFWLFVLVFATPPIFVALRQLRASRRSIRGRCSSCGYDLRATPDRCPECGTIPLNKEIISN